MYRLIAFFVVLGVVAGVDDVGPSVKTPLGGIRGYYKKSQNGKLIETYEGIPYAQPPVKGLRFKEPQKVKPWTGELQATKLSDFCIQYSYLPVNPQDPVEGSEDCLYLNVYVPARDAKDQPLPVMFWIHGGAFQYGAGNIYGPKYLADRDVILVTVNYRLGIMGFLSTEDEVVPGNMGLKDQNLALRWVHENIEWFGGDPEKVTLVGVSAGGVSTHYHYLSPMSAELFQNGISVSGSTFLCWAQAEASREKAQKLGEIMGCPTESTKEMIQCLRQRPARSLIQANSHFMPWLTNPFAPFGPVVEKAGNKPFLNRSPAEILSSGEFNDVPWITGVVSEEGLYPVAEYARQPQHLKYLDENWNSVAPFFLDFNYTVPESQIETVSQKIRDYYFQSKPINRLNLKQLIAVSGDRTFVADSTRAARVQAKSGTSPVYFYYYDYRAAQSLSDSLSNSKENYGVSHGDDGYLVVDQPYIDPTTSLSDLSMQEDLLNMWTSFAKTGKPNLGKNHEEWKNIDPSRSGFEYLHINGPGSSWMERNDDLGNREFWHSLNFNENKVESLPENLKDEL